MSKRANVVPTASNRRLGDVFDKLGDPTRQAYFKLPADEEDLREFLKAARKLFVGKTNKNAKKFLKMPIDTPDAAFPLVRALVTEIARIKQKATEPSVKHDQAFYHRLEMARLIERGLKQSPRTEAFLKELTLQILKEADRLTLAEHSQDGGKGGRKPNQKEQEWAAQQIEQLRRDKPVFVSLKLPTRWLNAPKKSGRPLNDPPPHGTLGCIDTLHYYPTETTGIVDRAPEKSCYRSIVPYSVWPHHALHGNSRTVPCGVEYVRPTPFAGLTHPTATSRDPLGPQAKPDLRADSQGRISNAYETWHCLALVASRNPTLDRG